MKTIQLFTIAALLSLTMQNLKAQNVGINTIGAEPNEKALLDIDATGSNPKGGLLVPRMTTEERNSITAPIPESLIIYNTSSQCFEAWNATTNVWAAFGCLTGNNNSNACTAAPAAVTANAASDISFSSFKASWSTSPGTVSYFLEVSIFQTFHELLHNINAGSLTNYTVIGLEPSTTYYYRVKAVNNCGASDYSNVITINTSQMIPICGAQAWASANVNVGLFISAIGSGPQQTNNGVIEKLCYNNIEANCDIYGGLYEWGEMMNYTNSINCDPCGNNGRQGLCPDGYHIPTDFEWSRYEYCIFKNVEPKQCPNPYQSNQCAERTIQYFQINTGWREFGSNTNYEKLNVTNGDTPNWNYGWINNNSNFGALPGGFRGRPQFESTIGTGLSFQGLGQEVRFWTASEALSSNSAWSRVVGNSSSPSLRHVQRLEFHKNQAFYLRCIKN
jgi:uncharacterized protein (TIGR02145 family)